MNSKLVCTLKVKREKFVYETYLPSDDIFALVVSGSFTFSCNGESYSVGPLEGALFRKGVLYNRKVKETVVMYLFRYKSESSLFFSESGKDFAFSATFHTVCTIVPTVCAFRPTPDTVLATATAPATTAVVPFAMLSTSISKDSPAS